MKDGLKNEKGPGGNRSPLENTNQQAKFSANSTRKKVQMAKLLERLRVRPHHTYELRQCGISHPAGRILNLVERGYLVESARVVSTDSDGFTHRGVALYSLIAEPKAGAA